MASLVDWLAYSGARTSAGAVVASGNAYFYEPGTNATQVSVYSDADGLVAVTQPVALDAGGRASVWVDRDVRVEVEDATGAVVLVTDRSNTVTAAQVEVEIDGYTGTSLTDGQQTDGGRTDLHAVLTSQAYSVGGQDGFFKTPGGSTSRPVRNAIGRWISPSDFGALGDDAHDDTAAINACIASAMSTGRKIHIEDGTYRILTPLVATGAFAAGLHIEGANRATTIIKNMATTTNAMTINLSSAIESHIMLRNFSITANTVSSGTGLVVTNGNGPIIEHVCVGLHHIGIDTSAVSYAYLENCLVLSTDSVLTGKGFYYGAFGRAMNCRVTAAANSIGHDIAGSDCVLFACRAAGTVTAFNIGAFARSGCAFCISTDASTADFATNASSTAVVEAFSTFTTRVPGESGGTSLQVRSRVKTKSRTTATTTGAHAYAPDPKTGQMQVYVWNGGSGATVTTSATPTTGLVDGQEMDIVISNITGAQTLITAWNAQYTGTPTESLTNGQTQAATFVWRASNSKWICSWSDVQSGITSAIGW